MFEIDIPSLNARDTDILVLKKIDMILIDINSYIAYFVHLKYNFNTSKIRIT